MREATKNKKKMVNPLSKLGKQRMTQQEFDGLVVRFIVKRCEAIRVVEDDAFKELIMSKNVYLNFETNSILIRLFFFSLALLNYADLSDIVMPTRYHVQKIIGEMYADQKNELINELEGVHYICATADIWSHKSRSFLGITLHWLEESTLERKSAALCCTRFKHPHDNESIAEKIMMINHEYGIAQKIITTVTDNASNFVKAFMEFGISFDEFACENENDVDDIEFPCIQSGLGLSCHLRCGSHTFNLIGSSDKNKLLKQDVRFKKYYDGTFEKLANLWGLSRSQKATQAIFEGIGSAIKKPVCTRWNSEYDSVVHMLAKNKENLKYAMESVGLEKFTGIDYEFLQEYVKVLKPIAVALDTLQQDKCYFGIYLPVLLSTKEELEEIQKSHLNFCAPLVDIMIESIDRRYESLLSFETEESKFAVLAACTHPFFKLRWIKDPETAEMAKKLLLARCHNFHLPDKGVAKKMKTSTLTVS